jgi:hypothetical protein
MKYLIRASRFFIGFLDFLFLSVHLTSNSEEASKLNTNENTTNLIRLHRFKHLQTKTEFNIETINKQYRYQSLIYIGYLRAWLSVNQRFTGKNQYLT